MRIGWSLALCAAASFGLTAVPVRAAEGGSACAGLPGHAALKTALKTAQAQSNGGFGLNMWATVVNRDGIVCAVVFTGSERGDQWPGSRVISAQKASLSLQAAVQFRNRVVQAYQEIMSMNV